MPSSKLKREVLLSFFLLVILLNPLISFAADANQLADEFYNALTAKFPFEKPSKIDECISDYVAGKASGNCAVLTYCVYNDYQGLNLKSSEYCTNYCVNTFLTPSATLFYNYIKQGKFKEIRDLISDIKKSTITNPDPTRPSISYTNTACSQTNHASGFFNTFNLLGKINKLDDIQNILNGLGIISPTTCYDSIFYSRMKELLSNYPFNLTQYQKCDLNNITKECLYNTASALEKDKNVAPLNPYNDPGRAIDVQNLADAIRRFADCPNETNLAAIASTHFAAIVGETTLQPNPDEDNCLIEFISVSFWDVVKAFFAPWSEISHMIIRIFAAIALGIRAIVGYVANAFVWAFVGLPKKLGGYIHFPAIYDASTKTGVWYTILIFANLGIVIGMIFVAIATILRIEKYSWKKMLPKLLLVALLVNFSLVILGIFVDISNYLSMTFLAQTSNNQLGDTIKNVITQVSCPLAGDKTHFVPDMTAVTVAIILSGIFLFQFIGLLFYVITRIFTIWVCAATAPLAFLGMAIDADPINNAVKMWRDRFTQAIVSLPILSFVLYFILKLLGGIGAQLEEISNSGNALNFPMLIAYAALVIGAAQVLRFVAKSIGIEQIEKGYAFAKKAVTGAVMAGVAAMGGFALGRITTMGARTRINPDTGETEQIPSYYDRAANAMTHIPVVGSRLALNLYKIKGKTTGMLAEKINKEIDVIKENENALNAYFDQALTPLARLKAIAAKSKAGLTLRDNELDWFMNYGSIAYAGSQDVRDVQRAIPVTREGGHISIENAVRRITPVLQNRESSEKLLGTNIFDYMNNNRPTEFDDFVRTLLRSLGSPRQLQNLILSIDFRDQDRIINLITRAVGGNMRTFLTNSNPQLLDLIDNPPPEENAAIVAIRDLFHL